MRTRLTAAAATAAMAVALAAPTAAPAASKAAPRAFRSCDALLRYAHVHALDVAGPAGIPSRPGPGAPFPVPTVEGDTRGAPAAAAPAGSSDEFSGTNVQEVGVDEPDLVKTDGKHVFAVVDDSLRAVDVRGAAPKLAGTLKLDGYGHELLLFGTRLLIVSTVQLPGQGGGGPVADSPAIYYGGATRLTEVDVSDPGAMKVVRTLDADGDYVSARLRGGTARVAIASSPRPIPLAEGDGSFEKRQRAAIRRTRLKTWVPSYQLRNARTGKSVRRSLVRCRAARRPVVFSGLGMLTVLTIDLEKGLPPVDSDGLMTDARTVYGSPSSLYVATERWVEPAGDRPLPSGQATTIHRFDTRDSDHTTFRASGSVRGFVLNQWSLSEHDGRLRVATTEEPLWWTGPTRAESESFVTVLEERSGALEQVGQVGGLGRGERIYAVRFAGDAGYVVTFRQVDPLYTLDLSSPAKPRVAGELKIVGYSAYLHPIGDDLLLGVGQDATEEGRTKGTQLSLFDVSDLASPKRLSGLAVGHGAHSEAEFDHHAFLWWPATGLAVIPVEVYPFESGDERFTGAIGFGVARAKGISEAGRVTHPGGASIRRALVAGGRLVTVSGAGVRTSRLDTLGDVGFAAFP
jgi:hypothetical protein